MVGEDVHRLIVIVATAVVVDVEYPGVLNIAVRHPFYAPFVVYLDVYDMTEIFLSCSVSHWITLFCFVARP